MIAPDPALKVHPLRIQVAIASDISSGFWEWIKQDETEKLIPIVAFPLAAPVYPFKGESNDLMVQVLMQTDVAAHFRSSGSVQATLAQAASTILSD